ncbi:hypothetical protein [Devosia sp. 2618]|uniref:hypothetical protein n=1 Tax=Devosia sp. 2618 TaxID=3156454 RepID=UPI003398B259
MGTRTDKRSRSGAHVPCPTCGKRVRTAKGLIMHIGEVHPDDDQARAAVEGSPLPDANEAVQP